MYSHTTLVGRVGKDPSSKKTQAGHSLCQFSLATLAGFGEKEQTTWHNIEAYGKTGEACQQYVTKGSVVVIDGQIRNSEYEKEGRKVYYSAVIANNVRFLSKKEKPQAQSPGAPQDYSNIDY